MSRFRLPKLRRLASLANRLRNPSRRSLRSKPRSLQIDPLEERALLSVSPADYQDVLVNEHRYEVAVGSQMYTDPISLQAFPLFVAEQADPLTYNTTRPYRTGQSTASDHDGDFVVTWTQYDYIRKLALNPDNTVQIVDGNPVYQRVYDPKTGTDWLDGNIYARYFTDEVQRISLPNQVLTDANSSAFARATLRYGGNEVQKLSVTATFAPTFGTFGFFGQENIAGTIVLGYDKDNSGTIDPLLQETTTIVFNESDFASFNPKLRPEYLIQEKLRLIGGDLTDVVVEATNSHEYLIKFGAESAGADVKEIVVVSANFSSGFFPAAVVDTVRNPFNLGNIGISPTDPEATAEAIRLAFFQTSTDQYIAPINFQSPEMLLPRRGPGPYQSPLILRQPVPEVVVRPVYGVPGQLDGTVFDITFSGAQGKQNHPELKVEAVQDEAGNALTGAHVKTLKESSPMFRVNPDEVYNPLTDMLTLTDQIRPAVAMDADGDFVVTWQSDVPDTVSAGSMTDVYARRFSPVALVAEQNGQFYQHLDDDGTPDLVQGVKALGGEFLVNSTRVNMQQSPTVAMDFDGNFIIAWSNFSQNQSYFNRISGQLYDRDGNRVGQEFSTIPEATTVQINPNVALSNDGHFAVAWETTSDPGFYIPTSGYVSTITARIYEPGVDPVTQLPVASSGLLGQGQGYDPHMTFDSGDHLYLTWDAPAAGDSVGGIWSNSNGVEYDVTGALLRSFRINSGTSGTAANPLWSFDQWAPQIAVDADGDFLATYMGYGPDVSDGTPNSGVYVSNTFFQRELSKPKNQDLLPFFSQSAGLPQYYQNLFSFALGNVADVDGVIETVLVNAINAGATDHQVGRIRAILDGAAGLLRGESNGVFYTAWDADAPPGVSGVLTSDNIANATRDGHNTRFFIALDRRLQGGDFNINLSGFAPGNANIQIGPVYTNNIINPGDTLNAIQAAIRGAVQVGTNWVNTGGAGQYQPYNGPVSVRMLDTAEAEYNARIGTPWDLSSLVPSDPLQRYYIYEVTLQGEVHDQPLFTSLRRSNTQIGNNVFISPIVFSGYMGEQGREQAAPGLAMEPDGSFVSTWTQLEQSTSGGFTNSNIFYRRFIESTDTAGPMVTDFLLPSGERLRNNAMVNTELSYVVVTIDEEMMRAGPNAVTDPANWSLMRNGVDVFGGVYKVEFGMNRAADLSAGLGLNQVGSNKWEAILYLDGDGVGGQDRAPLVDGHYSIAAKSALKDRAGNPLNRTGYLPNGSDVVRTFDVLIPKGVEQKVNSGTVDNGGAWAPDQSPKTVASDGDGNYVSVWTSDNPAQRGIWAKLYGIDWTNTDGVRDSNLGDPLKVYDPVSNTYATVMQFRITDDPTASYASVARDADGDFVVTWSQQDLRDPKAPFDPVSNPKDDWNVWARRYKANGEPLDLAASRVNTFTRGIQRYSTVAMDTEGDFVVTWQSYGQEGFGSQFGYGIYAQRYSPSGDPIGGADEVQMVTFRNNPRGVFVLMWQTTDDPASMKTTGAITYSGNTVSTAAKIQQELLAKGLHVSAQAVSRTEIAIRFIGVDGSKDQRPLGVVKVGPITGDSGADIQASTLVDGSSGEFLVNDTTRGNQMYPDIAMSSDGTFVITWTSYGQANDRAWETNVFAKRFISNQVLQPAAGSLTNLAASLSLADVAKKRFFITTTDDPGSHVVGPGSGYDGVVQVNVGGIGNGSGTLLSTGMHIVTAAHVVTPFIAPYPAGTVSVTFNLPTGDLTIPASRIDIHPNYLGIIGLGADIAIITLATPAPAQAERHDIYRLQDEVGRVGERYGYGYYGTGTTGWNFPYFGTKRQGENRYDVLGTQFFGMAPDILIYDFDDGTPEHDALGQLIGVNDLGLGEREASGAPGDSGGPIFVNGKIAGVTSFGMSFGPPIDVTNGAIEPNSSFGELGGDTRVSFYANWIDTITVGGSGEFLVNQFQTGNQRGSSIAMDSDGDFTVAWTSYGQDGGSAGPGPGASGVRGVFARRYGKDMLPLPVRPNEFRVNTFIQGNQQNPRVAMDADGDFIVAWESYQDRPAANSGLPDAANSYGIYAQRYVRNAVIGTNPMFGANGELSAEFAVNVTKTGNQRYPGVAMDHAGDFFIAWSGPGTGGEQGVYFQRFDNLGDDAGPTVADVLSAVDLGNGQVSLRLIRDGSVLTPMKTGTSRFVLEFDENLVDDTSGPNWQHSVLNPANWDLTLNGRSIRNGITSIEFGPSEVRARWNGTTPASKYQAIVTIDADPAKSGLQPLGPGTYELTLRDNVQDKFGNPLDGDYDGTPGLEFRRRFTVSGTLAVGTAGPGTPAPGAQDTRVNNGPIDPQWMQESPAIASDSEGNYVVVWVDYAQFDSALGGFIASYDGNIMMQRFDRFGRRQGVQTVVHTFDTGNQFEPDVAMDPFGNFIVVWSGQGADDSDGIYARRFDPFGVPLGAEFRVNQKMVNLQNRPAVAADAMGNFVITWTTYGQDGDDEAVHARLFDSAGAALGNEFRVNTYTRDAQDRSDVAMGADGSFVVVWQSQGQDGADWGVYGQQFDIGGGKSGDEFRVNATTNDRQMTPQVAMDALGDFVVVWAGFNGDGSGFNVYGRRYGQNASGEFRVNKTTAGWQQEPAVAMDRQGNFIVSWTSYDQEPNTTDQGVFARMFQADGGDTADPANPSRSLGEFRVNAIVVGDQVNSAVAMDADGDVGLVWEGPDDDPLSPLYLPWPGMAGRNKGVFLRTIVVNAESSSSGSGASTSMASLNSTEGIVLNGFLGWSGGWSFPTNASSVPGRPVLISDNGVSTTDRITSFDNSSAAKALVFEVPGTKAGALVKIYANGLEIGSAMATGTVTTVTTDGVAALASQTWAITASQTEEGNTESADSIPLSVVVDAGGAAVLVERAAGQTALTDVMPARFRVNFSEPVSGFTASDVVLGGTATGMQVLSVAAVPGSNGAAYEVQVTATGVGTINVSVPAGAALDLAGNPNSDSTGDNNSVEYVLIGPLTATLNQAAGQADLTRVSPIHFTVVFNRPVTGFEPDDLLLSGTAGPTTAVITPAGDGLTFDVAVSGMTRTGSVRAVVKADSVTDVNLMNNLESMSLDNRVTYEFVVGRYDFGKNSSPVEPGWTQVTEATRYTSALGYGWNRGTIGSRDVANSSKVRRDVNYTRDGTFVVDVPNGVYEVTAYLGDPSLRRDRMVISAENQTSGQISTNRSTATWTRRVEVTDGQLTLRLRDLGGADRYASISGLTVTSVFVPPQMTIGDVTLPEPAPGTQQIAEFVVSLSKPFEDDVTVEYSTIDALAKAGLDYVAASGVLTIPAGQTSGTISVAVLGDSNTELRESFYVNLRNASGAIITDGQAQGTILPWNLSLTVAPGSFSETAGSAAALATLTRLGGIDSALTVTLTSSDTSEATVPGSVQFAAGQASVIFPVSAVDDLGADRTQIVSLEANAAGYDKGTARVEVTDDEFSRRFDFGTSSSPVQSDYTRVSNGTRYSDSRGYGWLSGAIGSVDTRSGSYLTRDLNYTGDGTFAVNVPNGTYEVTVTLGDRRSVRHDYMAVILEGSEIERVTTSAGQTVTRTYTIPVTDGQLNMRLKDMGGRDRYVAIEAMTLAQLDPTLLGLMAEAAHSSTSTSTKGLAADQALLDLLGP